MNGRQRMWDTLAAEHPGSYWAVQSAQFYGISTLIADVAGATGWTYSREWPPLLLAAYLFGGFMLWMARRRRPATRPAS